jgi:hypothetical protein
MSQVVEVEVLDTRSSACRIEAGFDVAVREVGIPIEKDVGNIKTALQARERSLKGFAYGYLPALAVLGLVQKNEAMFQIDIIPLEAKDLAPTHSGI